MRLTRFPFANREEFLAIRDRLHAEHRLGGSDVGTAAGQNKHKSRRRFYEEMVGNLPVPDISNKQSIKDGIICEDIVAQKFCELTGKSVHRWNAVVTSDAAPHLFASIDRKVENENAGLECKTANARNEDAFKDGKLPDSYVKQVKTYLKVTGFDRWYVLVWVMGVAEYCYIFTTEPADLGNPPSWANGGVYFVNEMELDECDEIAEEFVNLCESHTPPPCDGTDDEQDAIRELYPFDNGKTVEITDVTTADLDEMAKCEAAIKVAEATIKSIKSRIMDAMGEHQVATIDGRKVTWKNNKASTKTDWKACCADAGVSSAIIENNTATVPGARVLRISK